MAGDFLGKLKGVLNVQRIARQILRYVHGAQGLGTEWHHLEKGPVDNENKAENEDGDPVVEVAGRIHHWQLLDPRLPSRNPEHARKGPVELEELERRNLAEEVDPQNSICPRRWQSGRRIR